MILIIVLFSMSIYKKGIIMINHNGYTHQLRICANNYDLTGSVYITANRIVYKTYGEINYYIKPKNITKYK